MAKKHPIHTFSFMKKIPWWSLLLEEVHNSLVSITQPFFSNEEEILFKDRQQEAGRTLQYLTLFCSY